MVLASANHFPLDAVGGLALAGLGMLATSRPSQTFAGGLWMSVDALSAAATGGAAFVATGL